MSLQNNNKEAIGSLMEGMVPMTSETMDAKRVGSTVEDFLLKLDQARVWVCTITGLKFDITSFTEELPKGIALAKVARAFDPEMVLKIFESSSKEYRHVDNIVLFLDWCKKIKLRRHFLFETIDLYESKNIPRVVYCLHGLAKFLSKRGVSKGIVVNKNVKFTEEETLLFSSELTNTQMPSYDNIDSKLDSEDEDGEIVSFSENLTKELPKVRIVERLAVTPISHPEECQNLQKSFAKTLIWKKALKSLISSFGVDVKTIRRFIGPHLLKDSSYQMLLEQQNEIIEKYKANNKKEVEMDSLIHTIRLLHENIQKLRNVNCDSYPLANDFKNVKMVFFRIIHDYKLCYSILSSGFELPIRTMFPDNTMGDFLFSKFVKNSLDKDSKLLISLARTHFMSSKLFNNISEVFSTALNFDLSPTNIKNSLYNGKSTNSLLEEALNDDQVRNEIANRSQMIIDFTDSKFKYLLNINLPYYVKIFADHPLFFENFIEPAITSSGNHTIAEVFSYIFADNSHLPSVLDIERIIKDKDGIKRSSSIDYSDYSPLKNYLCQCKSGIKNFKSLLAKSQLVDIEPNDYFIERASSDDLLQVEISIEEINNILVVLKHNVDLMTPELGRQVREMGFVHANSGENVKIGVFSKHGDTRIPAPVNTEGVISFVDPAATAQKYREIELIAPLKGHQNGQQNSEKFVLRLDNQFSNELDKFNSDRCQVLSRELKNNILTLILASKKDNFESILNEHESCFESTEKSILAQETPNQHSCLPIVDLDNLKKNVLSEIDSLVTSTGMPLSRQKILEMLTKDLVSLKCGSLSREIALNSETLDALFQKSIKLDSALKNLYKYTVDLTQSMFVNKSGIFFNREVEPRSKYGTYFIHFDNFKATSYELLDSSQMTIQISSNEPMIFNISVFFRKELLSEPLQIRYDSLLKMQEANNLCIDVNRVCCLSIDATISVINEFYVNY